MVTRLVVTTIVAAILVGPASLWFALIRTADRPLKRRLTLGELMAWTAVLAVAFAALKEGPEHATIYAVWMLASVPLLVLALYAPARWDLGLAGSWVAAVFVGVWMFLLSA